MIDRTNTNSVGDLARRIDVQRIRFGDHTTEQSNIDRVIRIHEATRLQLLERCRRISLGCNRDQSICDMLDLLSRQEHEESGFLQLLDTLIPTRLRKLEADGLQPHLGEVDRL